MGLKGVGFHVPGTLISLKLEGEANISAGDINACWAKFHFPSKERTRHPSLHCLVKETWPILLLGKGWLAADVVKKIMHTCTISNLADLGVISFATNVEVKPLIKLFSLIG